MLESLVKVRKSISNRIKVIKFKLRHKRLIKLSFEEITDYFVLEKNNLDCISTSPNYTNRDQYKQSYPIVSVKLYPLKNVYFNINSSSFIFQHMKSIYIEEFPYIDCEQADYTSGFLAQHDSQYAYVKKIKIEKVKRFEKAFFLGGNGSFNFYHWLIEIAPKLLLLDDALLEKLDVNVILVNDCVAKNDNYARILEQCSSHLTRVSFEYINQDEVFFADTLYIINTFNQTVYNYKKIPKDYQITTIYNRNNLKELRHRLSSNVIPKKINLYKKIFILRNKETVSKYNNRSYNQDEVFGFFQKQGFVGIYPESFTLDEQISIFKYADFIVGPSSATWSHLVFCEGTTNAISWLPNSIRYFDTYSTLANLNKVDMRFVGYEVIGDDIHEPYKIEVNDLIALYHSMNESS